MCLLPRATLHSDSKQYSLWVILKGYGKAVGKAKYPQLANRRQGRIARRLSVKSGNFCSFFLKLCISIIFIKNPSHIENFKNSQRLLFFLFSITPCQTHATFSQTQTSVTVPLRNKKDPTNQGTPFL
jgi:hypothetical protein